MKNPPDKDVGGAAFPGAYYPTSESDVPEYYFGMSLRDHFAAQALNSLIARFDISDFARIPETFSSQVAKTAYKIADAMLEARKK